MTQAQTNARVARASSINGLGNIASRVLGLGRETALTYFFGASAVTDAFQIAIIIPKAIYDLLIGGHVNGALIPVMSEVVTLRGRDALWRLLSVLMSVTLSALAVLVLLLNLFAADIVRLTASGASPQTLALASGLLRVTAPALFFLGLFAVFSGALIALQRFTMPAFGGVLLNGAVVLVTVAFAPPVQVLLAPPHTPLQPIMLARPPEGIAVVAAGWLVGALAQMCLQLYGLRDAKLRLTRRWRDPALRSIALLYAPVMFSLIVDTLITRAVTYNLASQTGTGSIAYMNWATTLIQFPQGLVGTAISIAVLPTLAAQAARLTDAQAFKDTLGLGVRLSLLLMLPAAVGLFVLAVPTVDLLFEHGAFTAADTAITAHALRLYLFGLPFAAVDLLLVYAFYARKDTLTPALIGVFSLVVYMLTALLLLEPLGLFSLMIADSVKHIAHTLVSAWLLGRRMGGYGTQHIAQTLLKVGGSTAIMGVVLRLALPLLTDVIGTEGVLQEAALMSAGVLLGGAVYAAAAYTLRVSELRWLVQLIQNRRAKI